ncbi:hypothetical protein [Cereibacter sphaeroides]|uniref:hypothetical protein n=1 Tax=Cereibacter sphaeroides TaxID=1063 RepID=UPI003FCD9E75
MTVIGGLRPDEVRPLADLLRLGLLPPGYWIHSRADQKIEGEPLLLLSPAADGRRPYRMQAAHRHRLAHQLVARPEWRGLYQVVAQDPAEHLEVRFAAIDLAPEADGSIAPACATIHESVGSSAIGAQQETMSLR